SGLSGCYQEKRYTKIIISEPEINLGKDTSICEHDSLHLKSPVYSFYQWSTGSSNQSIYVKNQGVYWVKATDSIGCTNLDTINLLDVIPIPIVNLGNDTSICSHNSFLLKAGSSSYKYKWQDNSTDTIYNVSKSGKYWVTKSNRCGQASDTINVEELSIYPPNIITPNGDSRNEEFKIPEIRQGLGKLTIYNSWGAEIYKTNGYNNDWNAIGQSDGVYYYNFDYETCKSVKGWLEVIR